MSVNVSILSKSKVKVKLVSPKFIKSILPDIVTEQSTGALSVSPDNITWYLVNAVKELSAKVKALEDG